MSGGKTREKDYRRPEEDVKERSAWVATIAKRVDK